MLWEFHGMHWDLKKLMTEKRNWNKTRSLRVEERDKNNDNSILIPKRLTLKRKASGQGDWPTKILNAPTSSHGTLGASPLCRQIIQPSEFYKLAEMIILPALILHLLSWPIYTRSFLLIFFILFDCYESNSPSFFFWFDILPLILPG